MGSFVEGGGRTKYDPKLCEEARQYIQDGIPIKKICEAWGIHHDTWYEWKKRHPEFAAAVDGSDIQYIKTNLDIIKNASAKSWQAAAWLLERRYPDLFSASDKRLRILLEGYLMQNVQQRNVFTDIAEFQALFDKATDREIEGEVLELTSDIREDDTSESVHTAQAESETG